MFCDKCGAPNADSARFCRSCGAAIAALAPTAQRVEPAPPPAPGPAPVDQAAPPPPRASLDAAPSPTEAVVLSWENDIRILGNPAVWRGVLLAFGVACGLGAVFFAVISQSLWGLAVGAAAFAGFVILFTLIGAIIDLFGGFHVKFALTTAGVRSGAGKGAAAAAGTAFWAGVLSGKPGLAGAGLLARSERDAFIPYAEVTQAKFRKRSRLIEVKGGFLQKPIGLFCQPETYQPAEDCLRKMCPSARMIG
jgi:hypothetical protein